jgi:hypothetical protein
VFKHRLDWVLVTLAQSFHEKENDDKNLVKGFIPITELEDCALNNVNDGCHVSIGVGSWEAGRWHTL